MVRDPIFKVTGKLLIDGQPQAQVAVTCNRPKDDPPPEGTSAPIVPSGLTDAQGKFSIGTYESADGVPNGTYVLTFAWGQVDMISGRYGGDRLKGKYKDPQKSEFQATVNGKPVDLGVIELKTN